MGGLWRRCIRLAPFGMVAVLVVVAACGGEGTPVTPTTSDPTSAAPSSRTTPTPTVQATVTPTATLSPTATPSLPADTPAAPTVLPQAASLALEVTTPAEDTVVAGDVVTVAGLTSPDATVSVNGILALPDAQGRFSVDLPLSDQENPLPIEVIATAISGEQLSVVRTVIFVR